MHHINELIQQTLAGLPVRRDVGYRVFASPNEQRRYLRQWRRASTGRLVLVPTFLSALLSPTEQAVRAAVTKHGVCTGSAEGTRVRSQRHLKRLTDLGLTRRLSGAYDGPAEYIHMLAGTTGRGPVFHTLDISELYVRLHERHITNGLDEADNGHGSASGFRRVPRPPLPQPALTQGAVKGGPTSHLLAISCPCVRASARRRSDP